MEHLRRPECASSHAWIETGLEHFVESYGAMPGSTVVSLEAVAEGRALFRALVEPNVEAAISYLRRLKTRDDWDLIALETAQQFERAWRSGQLEDAVGASAFGILSSAVALEGPAGAGQVTGINGSILLYVPETEAHCLGVEILGDRLRRAGAWVDTVPQAPKEEVLAKLANSSYGALAVSVGSDATLLGLADFIVAARHRSKSTKLRVVVGGQAISSSEQEYAFLGADSISPLGRDPLSCFTELEM